MSLSSFSDSSSDSFFEASYDSISSSSYDPLWTTDSDHLSENIDSPSNRSDEDEQIVGTSAIKDEQPESCFHRFSNLSIELRHLVWVQFCPELRNEPVILPFTIRKLPKLPGQPRRRVGMPQGTRAVGEFASRLRILVALHRESHVLAVNRFPDMLQFRLKSNPDRVGSVRFDTQRDIIFIKSILGPTLRDLSALPRGQTAGSLHLLPSFRT
ncbi:hypothetical protein NQ176_g11044 [Zarea fungicola]|uniref:Uncharacterized protein n=1 Tax=Zarea fungicola TaxID=93591 RepID=A0ACC1MD07_9HYPO|nr:hypothetical protein NQ176_g11044 [Lecanicillium fungicola]